MNIFKRLSDILEAKVGALINGVEDPEEMLNHYVEEAQEQLTKYNEQVNSAVADLMLLKKKIAGADDEVASWQKQAELAISKDRDDLATECLRKKKAAAELKTKLESQLEGQANDVEELKNNARALEDKLETVKRERDDLIARARRADAKEKANKMLAGSNANEVFADIDRIKEKVERSEAKAAAAADRSNSTLESQMAALAKEANNDVDDELAALKAKLKGEVKND